MNNYLGDYAEDADVYIVFDTADSTGLAVTATIAVADIEVYRQSTGAIDLVQRSSTTGFTLDVDHDAMTGSHMVAIDTSDNTDAGFFTTGYDYFVKLNTVTVDSITVTKWIGHFSIENRYSAGALRPTTAGRTLDVSATGEAGLDWANIGSPTTAQNLSATNIDVDQIVASVSGNVDGSVATLTTLPTIPANWLTSTGTDASFFTAIESEVDDALVGRNLDHLMHVAATSAHVTDNSALAQLVSASATAAWADFDNTTDSMQATRDAVTTAQTDLDTITGTGGVLIGTDAMDRSTTLDVNTKTITADAITAAAIANSAIGATELGDFSATMKTSVQTAVDAALDTAIAELGVAAPTATPTLRTGLMLLYMALRNKTVVQTSGTDALEIYNDAGTKIASKLLTDDGSDYTEAEMA